VLAHCVLDCEKQAGTKTAPTGSNAVAALQEVSRIVYIAGF
jgi:hypothetical protein